MLYHHILRSADLEEEFDKGVYVEKGEDNADGNFSNTNGARIDYIYQPRLLRHIKQLLLQRYIGNDCGYPANVRDVAHTFMVFGKNLKEIQLFPTICTMYRIKDEQTADNIKAQVVVNIG